MDTCSIDTLAQWARNRQLPPVVYNAPLTDRPHWQWLSEAPMAHIRHWAERINPKSEARDRTVYVLVEDHFLSSYPAIYHRAHWLTYPTADQVWAVLDNPHDSIWYTREIAEKIAAGGRFNHDGEESQFETYIGSYSISE